MIRSSVSEFVAPSLSTGPTCDVAVTGGGVAICRECGAGICKRTKSRLCRSCAATTRAKSAVPLTRSCSDCGTPISEQSKGRCRSCATAYYNRLPETKKKRVEGWKKRLADPAKYAQVCRTAARNSQKAMADPIKRAAAAERARKMYRKYLDTPEMRERIRATRKRAGEKIREHLLGWCPPEYRELHAENVNTHRMKAAQSREMIEKLIAERTREERAIRHPYFSQTVDFMRRLTAVVRLDNGNYRVGLAELTPGQLLQRAEAKGYVFPRYPQPKADSPFVSESSADRIAA